MNQNWIVENLNNAFSTWNGKLGELWGLVTTGPQTFKGGAVWSVMQTLHNGMVGIGYALVVLFFAISLCKNTMNFHELKRPEAAIHYFLRFVAAKALVGYGMDIMLNVFSICNGIVTDMADSMGGISEAMVSLPAEMQTAIENVGFLASIPLWLVTILGSLFITVLSFVMILTVYGRFFRLYMYTALTPLLGHETAGWVCIVAAAPIAAAGFFTYDCLTFEKFLLVVIDSTVIRNDWRLWKTENKYCKKKKGDKH